MRLGPIMQFSYVVRDLDLALEHWAQTLQVGPFFVLEHVPYTRCEYRGQPSNIDMSVAIAYSGDVQIELVQQHNDAASIFNDFLNARGEGLQHVGIVTEDLSCDLAAFARTGTHPLQQGEAENGTRFAYLNTDSIPGTMLELVQLPPQIATAFEYMRAAAASWKPGVDPIRR